MAHEDESPVVEVDVPTVDEAEHALAEAALTWYRKRRSRTYNNKELGALWDACKRLEAVRQLRGG